MGKAGWQVAAAIFASLTALFGAVAFNSLRALEVANAQLQDRQTLAVCSTQEPPSAPKCASGRIDTPEEIYEKHKRFKEALWQGAIKHGDARCINGTVILNDHGTLKNVGTMLTWTYSAQKAELASFCFWGHWQVLAQFSPMYIGSEFACATRCQTNH